MQGYSYPARQQQNRHPDYEPYGQQGPYNHRYKTALCRDFSQTGACERAENCQFAHGEQELRQLGHGSQRLDPRQGYPQLQYQNQPPYQQQMSKPPNFKTVMCRYWINGSCKNGEGCTYAHGQEDLSSGNRNMGQDPYGQFQAPSRQIVENDSERANQHWLSIFANFTELFRNQPWKLQEIQNASHMYQNGQYDEASAIIQNLTSDPSLTEQEKADYAFAMRDPFNVQNNPPQYYQQQPVQRQHINNQYDPQPQQQFTEQNYYQEQFSQRLPSAQFQGYQQSYTTEQPVLNQDFRLDNSNEQGQQYE